MEAARLGTNEAFLDRPRMSSPWGQAAAGGHFLTHKFSWVPFVGLCFILLLGLLMLRRTSRL